MYRRHGTQPRGVKKSYGVSVSETVLFGSKEMRNDKIGIKGYPVKMWNHDVDKKYTICYGIHKDKCSKKPRHFLDPYLKTKEHVPPPNTYNMMGNFNFKQNMLNQKSPRVFPFDEISRKAKLYKSPD